MILMDTLFNRIVPKRATPKFIRIAALSQKEVILHQSISTNFIIRCLDCLDGL
ncbi:hypothetical protein MTBSS4_190028 [Magnetospirillum sp. SS-4]|nr:hypothetical protein MTBSS4_190028 [Magnetospirillum sp. SS-4]